MAKEKESKHKNKKCAHDGIKFDSIAEGDYYLLLKAQKQNGLINNFKLQPKFTVQEKFKHTYHGNIRAIVYKADFIVYETNGDSHIIDVKGMSTPVALIKYKMFLKAYPHADLRWVAKSIKYGTNGWIGYFNLKKIRLENKKKRDKSNNI